MRALSALIALALLAAGGPAQAGFLDDDAAFGAAITALRTAIGTHPRVLRIEIDADAIAIEAQDPRNRAHVDRWRYGIATMAGVSFKRLTGPQPVKLNLLNPDLDANLFDLDAVDLSAAPKLVRAAIARAKLQDVAAVTRMEIARRTFILPTPTSGEVRWTLTVSSSRERAEIYADAAGTIVGADVGSTRRAQTLDILGDAAIVADAVAAFRRTVGTGAVLTEVGIESRTVGFHTNLRDGNLARLGFNMPSTAIYTWDLDGLQRRSLGHVDTDAMMGQAGPAPFSVDDVNWTMLAQLQRDAAARAAIPQGRIRRLAVAKPSDQPGGPALVWTVEIVEPSGAVTKVTADMRGAIKSVVLPESRRAKTDWLDPAAIAGAIVRIAPTFGADTRIASITFDARGGRITVDDRRNGGRPATFDLSADGATRASFSFSLDAMGPRFAVADLAPLDARFLAMIEADAMKRLGKQRQVWLESVSIGGAPVVSRGGAHAIEVRVRDVAVDSAAAHYAWVVFDFTGHVLDTSGF